MESYRKGKTIDLDQLIKNFSYLSDVEYVEDRLQPEIFPDHTERLATLAGFVRSEICTELDAQKVEEYVHISDFLYEINYDTRSVEGITDLNQLTDLAYTLGLSYEELMCAIGTYEKQTAIESRYVRVMRNIIVVLAHIENVLHPFDEEKKEKVVRIKELGVKEGGIKRHRHYENEPLDIAEYQDSLPEVVQFREELLDRLSEVVLGRKETTN